MNDDTAPLSTPSIDASSDVRRRPVVFSAGSLAAVERRGPRLLGRVGFVAVAGAIVLAVAMGAAAWSVAGSVGTGDRPDPLWYTPPSVSATTSEPGDDRTSGASPESAEASESSSQSAESGDDSSPSSEAGDDKGGSGGGGADDGSTAPAAPSSADDKGGSGGSGGGSDDSGSGSGKGGSDDKSGSGKGGGSDDNSGSGKGGGSDD